MAKLSDALVALSTMSAAQLRAEWLRVHGEPAPEDFGSDLMMRDIAHQLQVKAHGGLTASAQRQLADARRQIRKSGKATERSTMLQTGTRIARDWHGRTHHVLVLDDGFRYQDRHYRSLSAIARDITGAGWSGPRFFGLLARRRTGEGIDGQA